MNTVDGNCAVERVVNGVVSHVGLVHGSNHVEVDGVGSENEGLADCGKLNIVNTADG